MGIDREFLEILYGKCPDREFEGDVLEHGPPAPRKMSADEIKQATADASADQKRVMRENELANAGIKCEWSAMPLYAIAAGMGILSVSCWLAWSFWAIGGLVPLLIVGVAAYVTYGFIVGGSD